LNFSDDLARRAHRNSVFRQRAGIMKTHKAMTRRIKITKSGKMLHRRTGNRHLMSSKGGKRSRQLRTWRELPKGEQTVLKRQYG